MDCQSGCPPKSVNFAYFIRLFQRSQLEFGVPCLGQCLNVGIDGRTHATMKILVSTKNAVIPVWPNECNLQQVHARAQRI
jgi:hypothetical protein